MAPPSRAFSLFSRYGIEIEYMIIDRVSLRVLPIADWLIRSPSGTFDTEVIRNALAWSNELAAHLIEIKTNRPVESLGGLDVTFRESVHAANALLEQKGARLLGTGMHPFMDPRSETRLWPHGNHDIYEAFDRLFDCYRHGWANLQSVHLNLPFANDGEFGRLHAAVRMVLPIIPALAASSPIVEGRFSGWADTRLETYRSNSLRVPSITGAMIPEPVFTMEEYREKILDPIYHDLAPLDPQGILCDEWVNARGAIARFDRNAIEIRLIDAQETPAADLAIAAAVAGAAKLLTEERFSSLASQKALPVEVLVAILLDAIRNAEETVIANAQYLAVFGIDGGPITARDIWKFLIERIDRYDHAALSPHCAVLDGIITEGTLSSRIVKALVPDTSLERIRSVYRKLGDCLETGSLFSPT
jgi:gamma-glutamyl:cysteine ligase YbdK (ATP-grasp superfamily)